MLCNRFTINYYLLKCDNKKIKNLFNLLSVITNVLPIVIIMLGLRLAFNTGEKLIHYTRSL